MKRKIALRELKQIRKAIEVIPGRYDTGFTLQVAIALPHECDEETLQYAHQLILALRKVNCSASISMILTYPRELTFDKPYQVLDYIPLASPCIRVYSLQNIKRMNRFEKIKDKLKIWWKILWRS